jgi:DNA-binding beta-propeller fold protein YncE
LDLTDELRQLADEAASQARALPVAEVIRQGDRRATTRWPRGDARAPRAATQAGPGRHWPGWVAPLAAASGVILAVGLAVVLGSRVHHGRETGPPNDGRAETAYVFNGGQGTVTPISPVTGKLGKPVRVGPAAYWFGNGKRRVEVFRILRDLILPGGTTNYALYFLGHGRGATEALQRTSLVTGAAGQPIQLGRGVQQMVITPDGTTAYLTYSSGAVRPVSLAAGTVGKPILHVPGISVPAITPDGRTVYIPYFRQDKVIPISTATNTPGKPIPVRRPVTVAFSGDGRTAFVTGLGMVTPVSTATNTPGRTFSAGSHADLLAFAPDGRTVYVVNDAATSVTPISARTGKAGKPIALHEIHGAAGMVITPDGKTLYLASFYANRVTPISLATNTVGKPMNVPGAPLNIVITPDGRNAYTFSALVSTKQVVTPISTTTNTPGKPISTAGRGEVLIPGDQSPQ